MGVYICDYDGIHYNDIKKVFGSKDDTLFNHLVDSSDFDNVKTKTLTIKNALHHIIYGEPMDNNPDNSHLYGYAILKICQALGTKLPHSTEIKIGIETDYINNILADKISPTLDITDMLVGDNTQHEFSIPKIVEFPFISILHHDDLQRIYNILKNIPITDELIEELQDSDDEEDEELGYAYEHLAKVVDNIEFCLKHGVSWVLACH